VHTVTSHMVWANATVTTTPRISNRRVASIWQPKRVTKQLGRRGVMRGTKEEDADYRKTLESGINRLAGNRSLWRESWPEVSESMQTVRTMNCVWTNSFLIFYFAGEFSVFLMDNAPISASATRSSTRLDTPIEDSTGSSTRRIFLRKIRKNRTISRPFYPWKAATISSRQPQLP
jgi:hypothetical protein